MAFALDLLLTAHLLCVNVAAGGPLLCIWFAWLGRGDHSSAAQQLALRLTRLSLGLFFVGALIGVAVGGLSWGLGNTRFFDALARVPSKIFFGLWELLFYAVCMALAWLILARWKRRPVWGQLLFDLLAVAAATNLLWHFPPLFSVVQALARNQPQGPALDAADFRVWLFSPEVFSLTVHVWLASLAAAGVAATWLAQANPANNTENQAADNRAAPVRKRTNNLTAHAARLALAATVGQIPVGLWVFLSQPAAIQRNFGGGDLLATGLFAFGVLAAVGLMHQLANLAIAGTAAPAVRLSLILLAITVLLMVSALRQARGKAVAIDRAWPAAVLSTRDEVDARFIFG